jgi:RNA polymerase sigma-70 factor, ECF subfamily
MTDDARAGLAFDTALPEREFDTRGGFAAPGSDESDLDRARRGDEAAFASLFRRHGPKVYRFAWLLTGSESLADDVTQETFVRLLDGAVGFDPARGSLPAYLCGIARHLASRASDTRISYVDDIDVQREAQPDDEAPPLPLDALERSRALEQLYAAVRRLPSGYREVLILVELQEMSYADAAAVAGIELGTVRSRLSRAKSRLAALLHEASR